MSSRSRRSSSSLPMTWADPGVTRVLPSMRTTSPSSSPVPRAWGRTRPRDPARRRRVRPVRVSHRRGVPGGASGGRRGRLGGWRAGAGRSGGSAAAGPPARPAATSGDDRCVEGCACARHRHRLFSACARWAWPRPGRNRMGAPSGAGRIQSAGASESSTRARSRAGIDHGSRRPAVEGDQRLGADLDRPAPAPTELAGDVAGQLRDQVGLAGHLARLARVEVAARADLQLLAAVGEANPVGHAAVLLAHHHLPGPAHALLVPQDVARVEVVAQGEQRLEQTVGRGHAEAGAAPARRDARRRIGRASPGTAAIDRAPSHRRPALDPRPRPRRREEDQRRGQHQEREHADVEQHVGEEVKPEQRRVRDRPRAPPRQPQDDRGVEQEPGPAGGVGDPDLVEQRPDDRRADARGEPQVQRLRVQQPVAAQLGQPGVDVDHADLEAEQMKTPGRHRRQPRVRPPARVERADPSQRQEHEQERQQRRQVVVVEVVGDVDQLDVGEADREQERAGPVEQAERDAQREQRQHRVERAPSPRPAAARSRTGPST